MTDREALSGLLLPPLPNQDSVDEARAMAHKYLLRAFARVGHILRSRLTKPRDAIAAAKFIAEYAVGRPAQIVKVQGNPEIDLDRLPSEILLRIAAGQVNGAALLKLMPPAEPLAPEPDDVGEV